MRTSAMSRAIVLILSTAVAACEPGQVEPNPSVDGLAVALQSSLETDVTAVRFDVVAAEDGCEAEPLASQTVALASSQAQVLPNHAYASALILLSPGEYRVCATPLAVEGLSLDCAATEGLATVVAGQTSELVLVSQCKGEDVGGISTVVSLNKAPHIQNVTLGPSSAITVCETLKMSATALDPEGDALTFSWRLLAGSPDANLRPDGEGARLSGPSGPYLVEVSVVDAHQGEAALSFAVTITDAVCSVPSEVHDIMVAKCTPCHTTNQPPSAGMSLATPRDAYTSLVQRGVGSSACSSRVRVIPGDGASSYLIAKLRGEEGICGAQMPRGRDPLPESEIATILGWINDLPY